MRSGEAWSRIKGKRSFISVTDVLDIAWRYMQIDHKSFSAIICTSDEKMVEDNIKICPVVSDFPEIGIRDELPLETIKCVLVPKDKVDYVKVLFSDTNIQVLGLSNIDTRYFRFFMGCQFNAEEYEKYKANRLEKKEEISKITEEDLKENASSRTRSKMQEIYNWIVTLKERVINKNDSKRLWFSKRNFNALKKLPQDFINNLKDLAALSNKDFAFEKGKNFKEMDISSECKDFLAILIFNESNIEERKNLLNIWNYNEINN